MKNKSARVGVCILAIGISMIVLFDRASASTDTSADSQCKPVVVSKCGCGEVPDPKTGGCKQGQNKYQCVCTQTDNKAQQVGTCDASGVCQDLTTNGKAPQKAPMPSMPQLPSPPPSSQPTSQPTTPGQQTNAQPNAPTPTAAPTETQTPPANLGGATPDQLQGSSVFNSALQSLEGMANQSPQTSFPDVDQTAVQNALQSPLQNVAPDQALYQYSQPSESQGFPATPAAPDTGNEFANPGFAPVGTPQSDLGPSPADIATANQLVTMTPSELAAQDLQAIQSAASTVGGWTDTALKSLDTLTNTSPSGQPDAVDATIYYPGCVGGPAGCSTAEEGGLYGSKGDYLNPSAPIVAAGPASGYSYGDKLDITNPSTGMTVTGATVLDVCPSCGSGIDLNPYAASAVGLSQTQGTAELQVAEAGSSINPWSSPSGSLPTSDYAGGPLAEGWTSSVGGIQQIESGAVFTGEGYPAGTVESSPLMEPTASVSPSSFQPISADTPGGLSGGVLSGTDPNITFTQPLDAGDVVQVAQPEPSGVVTSAELPPVMPAVDTSLPSGEALTEQIYNSALADAQNGIPLPEPAQADLPTQAQMQADLLKQGQDFSSLDANSFYQAVQGNQIVEPGEAVPSGIVENGGPLADVQQPTLEGVQSPTSFQPISAQTGGGLSGGLVDGVTPNSIFTQSLDAGVVEQGPAVPTGEVTSSELPPAMPAVDTTVQSGEAITQQVYDSAIADAQNNVPVPEPAQADLPTQQQMQDDLLKQGQDLSLTNTNSFYDAVQGPEVVSPEVTTVPTQATPESPGTEDIDISKTDIAGGLTSGGSPQFDALNLDNTGPASPNTPQNTQDAIEVADRNFQPQVDVAAIENAGLQDRLAQADIETNAFNNPAMPPVDTSIQSGEVVTQEVLASANAGNTVLTSDAPGNLNFDALNLDNTGPISPNNPLSTGEALSDSDQKFEPGTEPPVSPDQNITRGLQGNTDNPAVEPIQNPPLPQARPDLPSNPSIVDYLNSVGQDASFKARADLAVAAGIVDNAAQYVGSAAQNILLLKACFKGVCI